MSSSTIPDTISLKALVLGVLDYTLMQIGPGYARQIEELAMNRLVLIVMTYFSVDQFLEPIEATSKQIDDISIRLATETVYERYMLEGVILLSLNNGGNTAPLFKKKDTDPLPLTCGLLATSAWSRIKSEVLRKRILDQYGMLTAFREAVLRFDI